MNVELIHVPIFYLIFIFFVTGSFIPREAVVDLPRLCPAGLWLASSADDSTRIGLQDPDTSGQLAERHHISLLHFWILTSAEDPNGVCEHGHGVRHVCSDAAGPLGVVPLRPTLAPRQPVLKCSSVCLCVSGLEVNGGTAHLRHAQLCPARVCTVALSAAEAEGKCPKPVYRLVRRSVHWRGGWSGLPVTRGSRALSAGVGQRHIALPPAASQATEAQGQHPRTVG